VQAPAPPPADDDEAYCNAIADGLVRGALTSGRRHGDPPWLQGNDCAARSEAKTRRQGDIPNGRSETDKEIKHLTAPAPSQP
jgi:hypothetical protein